MTLKQKQQYSYSFQCSLQYFNDIGGRLPVKLVWKMETELSKIHILIFRTMSLQRSLQRKFTQDMSLNMLNN